MFDNKTDYMEEGRKQVRESAGIITNPLKAENNAMGKEYVELKEGAYRVGGTRVSLDSVVYEFQSGSSPECIQQSYPALTLEQVYGAIAYYLSNRETINQYLIEGEKEFDRLQQISREKYPEWYEKMEKARRELLTSQS